MPWSIERRGGKHCVVKQGASKPVPGGCHDSRADAIKHQRALYANEKKMGAEMATVEAEQVEQDAMPYWQGVLAIEGRETSDRRYLIPGEITERELPLPLLAQFSNEEGHQGAKVGAGKITEIWREPQDDGSVLIMGRGPFDDSEVGREAARLVGEEMMRGVSVDLGDIENIPLTPDTYEVIDVEEMGLDELMALEPIHGMQARIMGATLVPFPAFEDATLTVMPMGNGAVAITASAGKIVSFVDVGLFPLGLVAAAAIRKPPAEWLANPNLSGPTPLTYTKEGRIYGHLAPWDGCHTGFGGVCIPPPRSQTNYSLFNVGIVETQEGEQVPCGKLMYSREGGKHADGYISAAEAAQHYDDSTCVAGYVRAGEDRFGIWLAGFTSKALTDDDIAFLRLHPPSGDWRPIGTSTDRELVAAFSVPVPGFPIPHAMVASAGEDVTAIILGPWHPEELSPNEYKRKKHMLALRRR